MRNDQLLSTKLYLPTVRREVVHRQRLVDRLSLGPGGRLTLVCAPAGYGKTTLVSSWRASEEGAGYPAAWLSLDPDDNDARRFFRYFVAALASIGFDPQSQTARMLDGQRTLATKTFAATLTNELAEVPDEFVLFLDDYHVIDNPFVHEVMGTLVEHLPPRMNVVILSRTEPPLPLARLRAHGKLTEIRSGDLRFTLEEIKEFFSRAAEIKLSAKDAAALEAGTEGWIAGLQLAALSAHGRPDAAEFIGVLADNNRFVWEYLVAEVFSRQPKEVQDFLEVTSMLDRMCGPLCDEVRAEAARRAGADAYEGASSSAEILERLEKANLFLVPLDQNGYWYRYHHLFLQFLRDRLNKRRGSVVSALHWRASRWYLAQGLIAEAVNHAFQSGDWSWAADLVESYGTGLLCISDVRTLLDWSSRFPRDVMAARPELHLLRAWAPVLSYREANRATVVECLENADRAMEVAGDPERRSHHEGHAALVRCYLAMIPSRSADANAELLWARRALDALPPDDPIRSSGELALGYAYMGLCDIPAAISHMREAERLGLEGANYWCAVEAVFHRVHRTYEAGQLRLSARACVQAREHYEELRTRLGLALPAVGALDITLAWMLIEQDDLAEAEPLLLRGLDLVVPCATAHYEVLGRVALFNLREIQGRDAEALACLDEIEDAWPDISFFANALRIRHLLRVSPDEGSTMATVSSWCSEFSPYVEGIPHLPGSGPFAGAETYYRAYLIWARAQIAIGQPRSALEYLDLSLEHAEGHGLRDRSIAISVERALALNALGQNRRALEVLHDALTLARPEGYVRSFDAGPRLIELLDRVRSYSSDVSDYAESLLALLSKGDSAAVPPHVSAESMQLGEPAGGTLPALLTEREGVLLSFVAQGLTNAEIAGRLYVETGTVKQHMNRIMRKLGAKNRTEAVAMARMRGLLK